MKPRIAVIGTSWWADAMYLPALTHDDSVDVVAVAGRDPERTAAFAKRWSIPRYSTDAEALIGDVDADGVIVATPNATHHPFSLAAIERGLAVLTEKPVGLDYRQAAELAEVAESRGVTTLVPFTYSFMPTCRQITRMVDDGMIGTPYHLNLRYYSGYARAGDYQWRFDAGEAGSGITGDLATHFLYLALWWFGPVVDVSAMMDSLVERPHPEGRDYQQAEDTAVLSLRFASGALGSVTATAMAHEPAPIAQRHEMELHGSEGTIRHLIDWDRVQSIAYAAKGDDVPRPVPIATELLGDSPLDDVVATYRNAFRRDGLMVREFAHAAPERRGVRPDMRAGADVQRVADAALLSSAERRVVSIDEIEA